MDAAVTLTQKEARCLVTRKSEKMKKKIFPYLAILPAVIFFTIFIVYPIFVNVTNSFFKWDGFSEKIFIGLDNLAGLFQDELFLTSLKNTFKFIAFVVPSTIIVSFILALFIDRKILFWQFYKIAFFLTVSMSPMIVGVLWLNIYAPEIGIINQFIERIGLSDLKQSWISDSRYALYCISVIYIWRNSGFLMMFFLAGMKTIPLEIYEQAKIDGTNIYQNVFFITIPLMKQTIAVMSVLMLIIAFKVFDVIWVMTKGGPMYSTHVLMTALYKYAFDYRKFGVASAISLVSAVFALFFSIFYVYVSGYRERR